MHRNQTTTFKYRLTLLSLIVDLSVHLAIHCTLASNTFSRVNILLLKCYNQILPSHPPHTKLPHSIPLYWHKPMKMKTKRLIGPMPSKYSIIYSQNCIKNGCDVNIRCIINTKLKVALSSPFLQLYPTVA